MENWVKQIFAVCPAAPKDLVMQDLAITRDPGITLNKILDGSLSKVTNHNSLTIDLSSPPRSSTAEDGKQPNSKEAKVEKRRGWGSLRPPSDRDMVIRRGPKSLLQPTPFEFLVVLDFEWTADNRQQMLPISEITQFPSVLVRLAGQNSEIVDEFNSYVRPELNPIRTPFSIELTGITQDMVNRSPTIDKVIPQYIAWLQSHGLVSNTGSKVGHWAVCTWSDADVGSQLVRELRYKSIQMPELFNQWIDLKVLYKRHFKKEPRGLQRCVEQIGLEFVGRAHDGLVDSQNTAAIVLAMARGSMMHEAFVFRRCTRGLDADGDPFGSKANLQKRQKTNEKVSTTHSPGDV